MLKKNQIIELLKNFPNNFDSRDNGEISDSLIELKKLAVLDEDDAKAKKIWCIEQILDIQCKYIEFFNLLKEEKYYDAWRIMEQIEIEYSFLVRHFDDEYNKYYLKSIIQYTNQFQDIYPYNLFISPEMIINKNKCSICGKYIGVRNRCNHEIGEIYNGEMCLIEIEDVEINGLAIVRNPQQKYSVMFLNETDFYNYNNVKDVVENLDSPFINWILKKSYKIIPHSEFEDYKKSDKCPCLSLKTYGECCLKKEGVFIPHYDVKFVSTPKNGFTVDMD